MRISDITCRESSAACGGEEYASSHHLVLTRGGVFVKHVGRQETVAEPTHALFFNAGEPYRVSHPGPHGDDCTVISAPTELWRELTAADPGGPSHDQGPFAVPRGPLRPELVAGYARLRQRIRSRVSQSLEIEETTLRLLRATVRDAYATQGIPSCPGASRHPAFGSRRRAQRDLAESTRLILARNPAYNHSLGELARALGVSPFHLAHVFRRETGVPIHRHLLSLRLALAINRLLERAEGLSTIAHSLGFSSHSHFTTLFSREFGSSPSKLRPHVCA
jgi:AraC family transcriptional regulator